MDHDEITCHAVGERRQNYLNQIRCILEQMDDTPCVRRTGGGRKPLIEYPGYVNMKNPSFKMKKCRKETPMIVNVPVKELRPTSEYWKHVHENDDKLQYFAVNGKRRRRSSGHHSYHERKKSYELVGGWMITGCDCSRHNGLQDDCRRTECQENPNCKLDPPSCGPASTYPREKKFDLYEQFDKAIRDHPMKKKYYCCCDHRGDRGSIDPRGLPKGFHPFPCEYH